MKNIVLIIDDMEMNRMMLSDILESEYSIMEAENGKKGLEVFYENKNQIAAVLLDLVMPVMDGFQVLEELNRKKFTKRIPVIVISGENSVEAEKKCLSLGTADFIARPFDQYIVRKRIKNMEEFFAYRNSLEEKVKEQTAILRKSYQLLQQQTERLKQRNEGIIDILGTVVEYRNLESGQHIQRVKKYTRILGKSFIQDYPEYGLTQEQLDVIVSASALHDIGKIAIPDHILLKPGKLTAEEFDYVKSHTIRGCEILEDIRGAWDEQYSKVSYEICRFHHERYDGRGYPDKLSGEQIPISAQLVSLADVYDALINERCYKNAYSKEKAYLMILNGECGMFSPKLMEVFRKVKKEFEAI